MVKTVKYFNEEAGKKERCTKFYWKPVSRCVVKRSVKYWKYYNTFEIMA